MKKKCMAALLTAAMMTSMMAGVTVRAEEAEGGTLKIMCTNASQPQEKEYITSSFLEGFREEYGIDVEVDFITQADGIKKIQTEQETGNVVSDLLIVDTANMAPYVNGGWMEDISETVNGTGVTYTTMFDESTNKEDARYFLPMSFDVYITIANVKALDYLPDGLTQEDVEKGLTWEQYADWAIAIAEGEGEGKTMLPTSMDGSQLLYPMGGMSLAYGGDFPEFTSQGFKDAMGVIAKIAEADAFYANQDQYNAVTEPLDKGDVWLTFTHMGPAGTSYNAAPNNFVIGAAPKGSQGAGSTAGAWCVGIQKGSQNAEAAQKFLEYISDPEVNYDYCTNMGGVLSPIEEVGDILESSDAIMKAGNAMLADTIISGVPSTEYSDWNAVKLLYGDVYNKIAETKAVPDDTFLEEMQGKLDALKLAE